MFPKEFHGETLGEITSRITRWVPAVDCLCEAASTFLLYPRSMVSMKNCDCCSFSSPIEGILWTAVQRHRCARRVSVALGEKSNWRKTANAKNFFKNYKHYKTQYCCTETTFNQHVDYSSRSHYLLNKSFKLPTAPYTLAYQPLKL